jgi:hypothetical protein
MKYYAFNILFFFIYSFSYAQVERPKVVIGIVVDQMRADYLSKFYPHFGEGGFKRLMEQGYWCQNTYYNYKPTYTGPGHASIFTGTVPAVHGIVANHWYSREEEREVYCVSRVVNEQISHSPDRLLSRTLADELKMAQNFRSQSIGISLKDRGAILPAGHFANAAYWFEGSGKGWRSDTYYKDADLALLDRFNDGDLYKTYLSDGWKLSLPADEYLHASPLHAEVENPFVEGQPTEFPYELKEAYHKLGADILKTLPMGNQMLADFAKEVIRSAKVGKSALCDFLSLSFSATDYVGHRFGVNSQEVEDTYIKLDRTLADLFTFFDQQFGEGQYLLFLTADHGAGEARKFINAKGAPGGFINEKALLIALEDSLDQVFGEKDWLIGMMNLNVYFHPEALPKKSDQRKLLLDYSRTFLVQQEGIADVYSLDDIDQQVSAYGQLCARGVMSAESGELVLLEKPNWTYYPDYGSGHGSPYTYDTHVPLLFYGWQVRSGEDKQRYVITDLVPSVAGILQITPPDGSLPATFIPFSGKK